MVVRVADDLPQGDEDEDDETGDGDVDEGKLAALQRLAELDTFQSNALLVPIYDDWLRQILSRRCPQGEGVRLRGQFRSQLPRLILAGTRTGTTRGIHRNRPGM